MRHQPFIQKTTGGDLVGREVHSAHTRVSSETLESRIQWSPIITVAIFLAAALSANMFAVYSVTQEKFVYFWDYATYWVRFRELSALIADDPLGGLRALVSSMRHEDYNKLAAFFLTPFAWIFGPDRLSYVLAITNIYVLPTALLMGLLVRNIYATCFHRYSFVAFNLAVLSTLVFHPIWIPVLDGLVDVCGCAVIATFLLLYIARPFDQQPLARLFLMGLLLCLMVLLRRWYLFWVVGFFVALALSQAILLGARYGTDWRGYLTAVRNGAIVGATFAVALGLLATGFLVRALITDYSDVYSAFRTSDSLFDRIGLLASYFGPAVTLAASAGLLWMLARKETRWLSFFLIAQAATILALFWRTQDFGEQHYYLLTPTLLLGITVPLVHVWCVADRPWQSWGLAAAGLCLLVASSMSVFSPAVAVIADKLDMLLPDGRWYPKVRTDLATLDRLLDDLGARTQDRPGTIYVLAASRVLNWEILLNACRYGSRPRMFCPEILQTFEIDKRDGFPNQLLEARYVVIGVPTQDAQPEAQRVIGTLVREVRSGRGLGAAFRRLEGEYVLEQGVRVWLYEKVKPIEQAALDRVQQEFVRYYPEEAYMFAIGHGDIDRYCGVKQKWPWIYEMIRTFRSAAKAACPEA